MRIIATSANCGLFFLIALVTLGIPFTAFAGGPAKGSVLMNATAPQQRQIAAIGIQAQNAQSAARNLGQTGFSVLKGSNGVTFLRLNDPAAVPSNALRSFQANGKVYAINRNGIIFGGPHQVNTGALAAAAMDATSNSRTKLEEQKRAKPIQTEVPSIITTEVIRYGK
jgi:large exoprotein involved in heme utilization and adhesion